MKNHLVHHTHPRAARNNRYSRILQFVIVALSVLTCDTFDGDQENEIAIIEPLNNISLFANEQATIAIGSWIKSPVKVKIECIEQPKEGYLEVLDNGYFKYTPFINATGSDRATFSIKSFGSNKELLAPQSVDIDIRNPVGTTCNFVAVSDVKYRSDFNGNTVDIYPTLNDIMCFNGYSLSIYKPSPSFMPHYGLATIAKPDGSFIRYTASATPPLADTIMYKIMGANGIASYGLIFIADKCPTILRNDFAALQDGTVSLNLLKNDKLCFEVLDVELTEAKYGQIERTPTDDDWGEYFVPGEVTYVATSTVQWSYDTIEYKVCQSSSECFTGRLIISADSLLCNDVAREDLITYSSAPNESITIDVLANDLICEGVTLGISTPAQHGIVEVDTNTNTIRYTPRLSLSDSFEYISCSDRSCYIGRAYVIYIPQ